MVKGSTTRNTKGKKQKEKSSGHVMRDKATVRRLQMYRTGGKAFRNADGKILKPAPFQSTVKSGQVARVEPNRKWFGNTRVITQSSLQTFQEEMGRVINDPYKVVMKQSGLPISLLNEKAKNSRVHLLDTESFSSTFGPKSQRKRPNLPSVDVEALAEAADVSGGAYDPDQDIDLVADDPDYREEAKHALFTKGQSRRIWNELYKVIDSSDVVIQVLDARDPCGTRSKQIEQFLKKEKPHKHLIFLLNKCDLVPTWATTQWVSILSAEYPTLAFHASTLHSFGKGALIQLLRQFAKLHKEKRQISVGFIGYPNVGKSSVINTLRSKKVCSVAPIAGETKVWQYITLTKRIYLIDCPGVVYPSGNSDVDTVLKGVVRVENVKDPADYIPAVLDKVKSEYIANVYGISDWSGPIDFLSKMAQKYGKLLKGGDPDTDTVAKMVLNDWLRGNLPYFVKPPIEHKQQSGEEVVTASAEETVEHTEEVSTNETDVITRKTEENSGSTGSVNEEEEDAIPSGQAVTEKLLLDENSKQSKAVGVEQDLSSIKVSSHFDQEDLHGPDNEMDTSYDINSIDLTDTHGNEDTLMDPNSSLQELLSNPSPGAVEQCTSSDCMNKDNKIIGNRKLKKACSTMKLKLQRKFERVRQKKKAKANSKSMVKYVSLDNEDDDLCEVKGKKQTKSTSKHDRAVKKFKYAKQRDSVQWDAIDYPTVKTTSQISLEDFKPMIVEIFD
ncbi:uncharacterized protein [Dysidea avara]|uniref:uncharacterized protein isoform X2 n=1 Tax=Dysidea avara TaxID=196820 RepID=UPI00331CE94C